MRNAAQSRLVITGLGITSAIGQGRTAFTSALMQGRHAFGVMQRPGRQRGTSFIGAEIPTLSYPEELSKRLLRAASFSGHVALVTLSEAWHEARLDSADPSRLGLVIGGSNLQQRELMQMYETYRDRVQFTPPSYGFCFMDSDLCGLCTAQFGIRGFAYTIGGASASGNLAVIKAIQALESGQVDICIAMGALMDLSYLECQGLRSLGAMGTDRYADQPAEACRPFDQDRDGFIYGEMCGAVVIESAHSATKRDVEPQAIISGWALGMDANRNPDSSYQGEVRTIKQALRQAKLSAAEVDYVNPHGTGSVTGDDVEVRAIVDCRLSDAYVNATKSIIGHGLSAAGTVELIATVLQMNESRLHPTRNLDNPLKASCNWVRNKPVAHTIQHALNLSVGFGGLNSAVCLQSMH